MTRRERLVGYHCSHEQYSPRELLELARAADEAGFAAAMCSDHFSPWSEVQGHSGSAWPWLGAALATTGLTFGTVSAPGYRYHPAVLAQSAATLSMMYPERLWIALGSGEAVNEHIATTDWPLKEERNERLLRCANAMRRLWAGESVTDEKIDVYDARLWDRPETPPLVVAAALTPKTAEWAGGWADALITTAQDRETMQEVFDAFHRGGGKGKPLFIQAVVSWAATDEEALDAAYEQWRMVLFGSDVMATLRAPREFDAAAETVSREFIREKLRISSDLEQHRRWLEEDFDMGISRVYVHNVNRATQREFIAAYGREVLPALSR